MTKIMKIDKKQIIKPAKDINPGDWVSLGSLLVSVDELSFQEDFLTVIGHTSRQGIDVCSVSFQTDPEQNLQVWVGSEELPGEGMTDEIKNPELRRLRAVYKNEIIKEQKNFAKGLHQKGMSKVSIACVMDIPESTVRTLLK